MLNVVIISIAVNASVKLTLLIVQNAHGTKDIMGDPAGRIWIRREVMLEEIKFYHFERESMKMKTNILFYRK